MPSLPVFQFVIQDENGDIQPSAEVTVLLESTGLWPAAGIFSDRSGTTPITEGNFFADVNGVARFYGYPNEYRVTASGVIGSQTYRYLVLPGTAARADLTTIATQGTGAVDAAVGFHGWGMLSGVSLSSNLDAEAVAGIKRIEPTTTNKPSGITYGVCTTEIFDPTSAVQWARSILSDHTVAYRRKNGGVWSAWQEIWHSGNLDYLTGTWSPVLGTAVSVAGVWAIEEATYVKVGKLVHVFVRIAGTGIGFTALTGYQQLTGLPFVPDGLQASGSWGITSVGSGNGGTTYATSVGNGIWLYAPNNTNTDNKIVAQCTYEVA